MVTVHIGHLATIIMNYDLYVTLAVSFCAAVVYFCFIVAGKGWLW